MAVRLLPLLLQRQPLMHAETMLFINDHQAQLMKGDRFLKQGMGADDHLRLSGSDPFQLFTAFSAFLPAIEPSDVQAQWLQPGHESLTVLFGKNFRRGHHGGLPAVLRSLHGGEGGHHGLAGAHIALYQSLHGAGLLQVRLQFGHDTLLGRCQ